MNVSMHPPVCIFQIIVALYQSRTPLGAGIWQRPATDLTVDLLRAFCLRVLGEAYA